MIINQWYAVLDSRELPSDGMIGVTRFSEKLVFWRNGDNSIGCIADKCCHRGASLSSGRMRGERVECPFHGFQYDSAGKVTLIPANGRNTPVPDHFRVRAYRTKEDYGFVWVWYGESAEDLPELPFFDDLKQGFSYSALTEIWNVHYSRAIENQLDVVHLPFVHKTTIGRGNKTLVNGPVVRWKENLMTFYVKNEVDHGQIPQKPDEIGDYEKLFSLQFQFPNLWQNRISEKLRIMAAFAPVDEEHTKIYLRYYQCFITTPLLRLLVSFVGGKIVNRLILHQDRRVVLTQQPKRSDLVMGENLIQGDQPIIEYRRRREEMKNGAGISRRD